MLRGAFRPIRFTFAMSGVCKPNFSSRDCADALLYEKTDSTSRSPRATASRLGLAKAGKCQYYGLLWRGSTRWSSLAYVAFCNVSLLHKRLHCMAGSFVPCSGDVFTHDHRRVNYLRMCGRLARKHLTYQPSALRRASPDCKCWPARGVGSDVEFGSLRDDEGVRRYTTGSATGTPSILMT